MKSMSEIKSTPRIMVLREAKDEGWAEVELLSQQGHSPCHGSFFLGVADGITSPSSFHSRKPTWDEMCEVKRHVLQAGRNRLGITTRWNLNTKQSSIRLTHLAAPRHQSSHSTRVEDGE